MADLARRFASALGVLVLLAAWTLVAVFGFGTRGAVPTPWAVVHPLVSDGANLYVSNAAVTLAGAAQGFLCRAWRPRRPSSR